MLGANDLGQRHGSTLLKRRNPIDRFAVLHFRPIGLEFLAMSRRPLANEPQSGFDRMSPIVILPSKSKLALLPLVLRMEVSRFMFAIEHPHDDSEEDRDDRHWASIPSSVLRRPAFALRATARQATP